MSRIESGVVSDTFRPVSGGARMPGMACSGKYTDETIRQIRQDKSNYVAVVMGRCEKCGRNVPAVFTGGEVWPERHQPLPGQRLGRGKRTGDKR